MIKFHWTYLVLAIFCSAVAFLGGILWNLSVDQASGIVTNLIGFLIGAVGVAVTLWVASSDRQIKFAEIHREITETRAATAALQALAEQMWQPALNRLIDNSSPTVRALDSAAEQTGTQLAHDIGARIEDQFDATSRPRQAGAEDLPAVKRREIEEILHASVEQVRAEVQSAVIQETQRMMKVAQLATLMPVERYMLRRLYPHGHTRRAYWTTWPMPNTQPFPTDQIMAARERLLGLGLAREFPCPPQHCVGLGPGVHDAIGKYEELYGGFCISPQKGALRVFVL